MTKRYTRRGFIRTLGGAAVSSVWADHASAVSLSNDKKSTRPNILFIMSDDHTTQAIGSYARHLKPYCPTKRIDRLAAEGMRLENCFCTNSICVPSRATILTGQYSHVNGVYTLGDKLDPARENVAKLMRRVGYQTAMIGKWHLKNEPSGFDYWNVLPGQGRYHNPVMTEMGEERKVHQGFSTDVITDLSLDWLRRRDRNQPFFLMTHFKNSHGPWHYAKRHANMFNDVEIPEPASLWEDKSHRSEGSREYGFTLETMADRAGAKNYPTGPLDTTGMSSKQRRKAAYQKLLKDYLRCVAAIDENVGRLLDYLDREGLCENTVVIYTSDQGYFLGEHNYIDKRWMFEEALRMPFIVRYPPEISAGSVNRDMVLNTDFAPTFLDYAGQSIPPTMQGRSFRANLTGRAPNDWRKAMYYRYWLHCNRPAHYGIRTERYKLIFYYGLPLDARGAIKQPSKPGWELYDLKNDPQELKNVYEQPEYSDVIKKLKAELQRLKAELGDTDERYPELMELRRKNTEFD